ncbi:hypothetical protein [Saccharothrix violaceirubra]|uniref:Uncharacterized protein n=1 Tax=Saccharothrix violaceirubra TaxID=413306 RepID=A0A7W7WVY0_9PSEU|nr:hypothetical protein [Saccharothrix violaceirubra]MBB4965387.1 hypothetical protein [Saccharothrix violaceirubra]
MPERVQEIAAGFRAAGHDAGDRLAAGVEELVDELGDLVPAAQHGG